MSAKKPEPEDTQEQELPQDELQQLIQFARVHGLPIALGIAIALAIISIAGMYRRRVRLTAESASTGLTRAMRVEDLVARAKQLGDVTAQYPSTPAAPLALMAAAKTYFDNGQTDVAINKYAEFQTKYPEHPHAVGAELGRLHCLEAMDSTDTALQGFEKFLAEHKDHYLAPQAILGKARCLVAMGRTNEAKVACEDLMVARPDTVWSAKAELLIRDSKRKRRPMPRATLPQTIDFSQPGLEIPGMPPSAPPISLTPPVEEKTPGEETPEKAAEPEAKAKPAPEEAVVSDGAAPQ